MTSIKKSDNHVKKDSVQKKTQSETSVNKHSENKHTSKPQNNNVQKANNNTSLVDSYNALDKAISETNTNPMNATNRAAANNQTTLNQTGAQQTGQDLYPERVNQLMDVNEFLNNVEIPADVQAQGPDAVNQFKLNALGDELHNQIYDENGNYKENPPIDDVDAVQTLMTAAADMSYNATANEMSAGDENFQKTWNEKFVNMLGPCGQFGDFGWSDTFQDGSSTQSGHFMAAFRASFNVFNDKGVNGLTTAYMKTGAHAHEILADGGFLYLNTTQGRTKEDVNNSLFAVDMASWLASGQLCPYSFSQIWASDTRNGRDIPKSAFYLPDANVDPDHYPQLGVQ